jgi:hypothetical protein
MCKNLNVKLRCQKVKTSVPSTELKYRCMSNCGDRLFGWTHRSISIGDNSSNEHDAGSFHECIMFCISIRRMSIFIMLSLGRRRVVSPIHIPLYVPQQMTPGSTRIDTTNIARSSQLLHSHINLSKPCVPYIGRAYRYPPDVAFYIFFFNNYKYWVF